MDILRQATIPPNTYYSFCSCGAIYKLDASDITVTIINPQEEYRYFICPNCKYLLKPIPPHDLSEQQANTIEPLEKELFYKKEAMGKCIAEGLMGH